MNKTIALIAAACIATPALAWGDREQGALAGIAATLIFQHIQRDAQAQQPVIVPQPQIIYAPAPQPQVIIQNQSIVCPQGLAPFYNQRFDRYGRPFYIFDGCR
jgi:hypothetical protein